VWARATQQLAQLNHLVAFDALPKAPQANQNSTQKAIAVFLAHGIVDWELQQA